MPNSLGNNDNRRIPIRQRTLHPSMVGRLDISETSSSDPGRSGSLTPCNNMKSLYFDDSLYPSKIHYRISKILDEWENDSDVEELVITCDNEEDYNKTLDDLFNYGKDKLNIYGVTNNPNELIIEKDPRDSYRKFDEDKFLVEKNS